MAAAKAKEIFLCLTGAGWEEALQRFKPEAAKPAVGSATVGDLIREVIAIGGLRPKTVADYAKAFRLAEVSERALGLAQKADEVHVVFNNNARNFAPMAAQRLRRKLGQTPRPREPRQTQGTLL